MIPARDHPPVPTAPGRRRAGVKDRAGPGTAPRAGAATPRPDPAAERALALENAGDRHGAGLIWLEVAASAGPATLRRYGVHRRLAKAAEARGDRVQATVLLERHLALAPRDAGAAERLLKLRLAAAAPGEEAEAYAAHVARFGETAAALVLRATRIEAPHDPDAALATLATVEARWLDADGTRLRLAGAYERLGDPARALALLDGVRGPEAASPQTVKTRLRLAQAVGESKDHSAALARRLIEAEPDVAAHHALLGRTLKRFNDWAGAAAAFEAALALDPGDLAHWEGALRALGALERDERIAELTARARRVFGAGGGEGLLALARIELAGGDAREAIGVARRALAHPILRTRTRPVLAEALMEVGAYAEAWTHLAAALEAPDAEADLQRAAARCAAAFAVGAPAGGALPVFPGALFLRALGSPPPRPLLTPTDTVMLVSSSLGAGGAERQVALTAAGVSRARGGTGRTVLVGLDLTPARGRSMMRSLAETEFLTIEDLAHVNEAQVFRTLAAEEPALRETLRLIGSFPRNLSRDILKLFDSFRRHRPSCVHLWQDGVISTGAVAAVLAGVPAIVCSMRNVVAGEGDRRRYRAYLATMYRALAERPEVRFTANSAAGARDYEAWLGFEPGRIRVLRNGVDVASIRARAPAGAREAVRARLNLPEGALLIGGVFRLAPAKRPHLWLDVVARIAGADPRVHGVIVGDGALRAELQEAIDARGLSGRITLAGRQSPVEPWMAAMDVLLLASEVEGLPNVLLEAESLGVPVVTTEAGGSGEALLQGVTGMLVKDDAPETLAAALVSVVRAKSLRHRARVGAPVFIEQRFGIERMIRETLAVFGETDPTRGDATRIRSAS